MIKPYHMLLSTTAMVLAAGQASAGALGAPNEIFIGGATAVQEGFQIDILERLCNYDGDADDADGVIIPKVFVDALTRYPGQSGANPLGDGAVGTPILNHRAQQVVYCDMKAGLGTNLSGARVAVYKFNGGSATGVTPVADPVGSPNTSKLYMDASIAGCTQQIPSANPGPGNSYLSADGGVRFQLYTCGTGLNVVQAPDGGVSDVEPKLFVGQLGIGFGASVPGLPDVPQADFVDQGNLIVKSGPGLTFGVGVTLNMYNELVADQVAAGLLPAACGGAATQATKDTLACMPSLPSALIQPLFSGELSSWTTRTIYGQALNPVGAGVQQGAKVNFCRRTAGSGTHAQFMVEYFRTNCIDGSPVIRTFANNVPAPVANPQVYENEGSSGVDSCLAALQNGTGFNGGFTTGLANFPNAPTDTNGNSSVVPVGRTAYAIGYNSSERNTGNLGTRPYRFVKIDGVPPTLQEAYNGNYRDIYYLSYQNRITGVDTPNPLTGGVRTVAADATEVAVHKDFFTIWNSPSAASLDAVNDGLISNPDGVAANGDEWQGGFLLPSRTAPAVFSAGPAAGNDPRTPWARETAGGTPDSCQNLSYKN